MEDVFRRAPDAEILTGWEYPDDPEDWASVDWRECLIPVEAFGLPLSGMTDYFQSLPNFYKLEEDLERVDEIEEWILQCGSPSKALAQCPILVRVTSDIPKMEDGYHRLAVTAINHGERYIRGVCAYW